MVSVTGLYGELWTFAGIEIFRRMLIFNFLLLSSRNESSHIESSDFSDILRELHHHWIALECARHQLLDYFGCFVHFAIIRKFHIYNNNASKESVGNRTVRPFRLSEGMLLRQNIMKPLLIIHTITHS
jgi:hypothetical protein